jgi:hypothetical protein
MGRFGFAIFTDALRLGMPGLSSTPHDFVPRLLPDVLGITSPAFSPSKLDLACVLLVGGLDGEGVLIKELDGLETASFTLPNLRLLSGVAGVGKGVRTSR